jgi:deoxyribose-phosphate aldolase
MTIEIEDIDIANYIDHALLNPSATSKDVENFCIQADQYHFPTVCVYPNAVKQAAELLHKKRTQVCTVISFPTGTSTSAVKLYEAQEAINEGAQELDIMINLGWLKEGKSEKIYQEIAQICEATEATVKVILETNVLTNTEKRLAAEICMDAGASFLKTSTGWFGGATVEDVSLLSKITKGKIGIKASGGIRNFEDALRLIQAGATRIGTSKGADLVKQQSQSYQK